MTLQPNPAHRFCLRWNAGQAVANNAACDNPWVSFRLFPPRSPRCVQLSGQPTAHFFRPSKLACRRNSHFAPCFEQKLQRLVLQSAPGLRRTWRPACHPFPWHAASWSQKPPQASASRRWTSALRLAASRLASGPLWPAPPAPSRKIAAARPVPPAPGSSVMTPSSWPRLCSSSRALPQAEHCAGISSGPLCFGGRRSSASCRW
mmetsp:Transcript_22703/g.58055  ORF Transcript_22703/g.58055 Transcript_22703/m.58055 type:complete len:204 (+) Transcript_22703:661-1272(+)